MSNSLNDKGWSEFFLTEIFPTIQRGKRLTKANQIKGRQPYISSTAANNCVDNYISNSTGVRLFGDCLTIANSGSVGSSFYQPFEFIASDHVTHLKNNNLTKPAYLFIAAQTNRLSGKYNFSREINDKRVSREKILLPIDEEKKPDWIYIERYSKSILERKKKEYKKYAKKSLKDLEYKDISSLKEKDWKPFKIEEVFNANKGVYLNKNDIISGVTPYITATSNNNGITDFIGNEFLFPKNTITVEKISLSSFYQSLDFYCSHDVSVLSNVNLNKFNSLFIVTMIKRQGLKYSYGRQAQLSVVKRETVYLPVDESNNPDWHFMAQYIKNLEYKKIKEYLNYLSQDE